MRRIGYSILITVVLAGAAALAGCQVGAVPVDAGSTGPMPLTGENTSRLGAVALTLQELSGRDSFAIVPVSADTGEPVADTQPIELGGEISFGFSHDRTQMAFLSNRTEGCEQYCLRVMDLRAWEEIGPPVKVEKDFSTWYQVPEFDQNSPVIPVIMNKQTDTVSQVALVDRSKGAVTARIDLPANVYQAVVTPVGNLAVFGLRTLPDGSGAEAYIALLNGSDLRMLWEKNLPEIVFFEGGGPDHTDPMQGAYYEPAKVFSPDGGKLYIVAADQPLLLRVDFEKQSVESVKIQRRTGWLERIFGAQVAHAKTLNGTTKSGVISLDGRTLYVVGMESRAIKNDRGEYEAERTPLGLQVIDTQDGALLREVDTDASQVQLSPDGKTILLSGWQEDADGGHEWAELLDTATWKVFQRLDGFARPTRLLDGSLAFLVMPSGNAGSNPISLYRPGDREPHIQISHKRYIDWIAIP